MNQGHTICISINKYIVQPLDGDHSEFLLLIFITENSLVVLFFWYRKEETDTCPDEQNMIYNQCLLLRNGGVSVLVEVLGYRVIGESKTDYADNVDSHWSRT